MPENFVVPFKQHTVNDRASNVSLYLSGPVIFIYWKPKLWTQPRGSQAAVNIVELMRISSSERPSGRPRCGSTDFMGKSVWNRHATFESGSKICTAKSCGADSTKRLRTS